MRKKNKNEKDKKPNINIAKRKTAVFQDVRAFGLNKEEDKKIESKINQNNINTKKEEMPTIVEEDYKKEDSKEKEKEDNKILNEPKMEIHQNINNIQEKEEIKEEKNINIKNEPVKQNKLSMKEQIEQKAKKMMMIKPPNGQMQKPGVNKKELENIFKAKKELKNMDNKPIENKNPMPQKNDNKVGGFKNIKEMIEQNLKKKSSNIKK